MGGGRTLNCWGEKKDLRVAIKEQKGKADGSKAPGKGGKTHYHGKKSAKTRRRNVFPSFAGKSNLKLGARIKNRKTYTKNKYERERPFRKWTTTIKVGSGGCRRKGWGTSRSLCVDI